MVSRELQDLEVLLVSLVQRGHLDLSDKQAHKDLLDQLEPEVHPDRPELRGQLVQRVQLDQEDRRDLRELQVLVEI